MSGNDFNRFKTSGSQMIGDPARGPFDIGLVFTLGADAGDAQEFAKLRQILIAAAINKVDKIHKKPLAGHESFPKL